MPVPTTWPASEVLAVTGTDGRTIEVRVVRSARRTRSVAVGWAGPTLLEARVPAHMAGRDIMRAITSLLPRLERQWARCSHTTLSDADLEERARRLNRTLFGGELTWQSIRWVTNQGHRDGSCTPAEGTIRVSDRMQGVPSWVLDYVLVHELAHLLEPNHSEAFWALVRRYPLAERARGFLLGMAHTAHLPHEEDDDADGA